MIRELLQRGSGSLGRRSGGASASAWRRRLPPTDEPVRLAAATGAAGGPQTEGAVIAPNLDGALQVALEVAGSTAARAVNARTISNYYELTIMMEGTRVPGSPVHVVDLPQADVVGSTAVVVSSVQVTCSITP